MPKPAQGVQPCQRQELCGFPLPRAILPFGPSSVDWIKISIFNYFSFFPCPIAVVALFQSFGEKTVARPKCQVLKKSELILDVMR